MKHVTSSTNHFQTCGPLSVPLLIKYLTQITTTEIQSNPHAALHDGIVFVMPSCGFECGRHVFPISQPQLFVFPVPLGSASAEAVVLQRAAIMCHMTASTPAPDTLRTSKSHVLYAAARELLPNILHNRLDSNPHVVEHISTAPNTNDTRIYIMSYNCTHPMDKLPAAIDA